MSTINTLRELQQFLSEKKQITELADRSKVSLRTVYDTFNCADFSVLKGKQIIVAQEAIKLVNEIKNMPEAAREALNL